MSDQIRVNGNLFSWGSIIDKVDGDRYYGFNKIAYADKRERVKGYGMGRHHGPRGRSSGKYSTDPVKLGGHKDSIQALRKALADKTGTDSYGNAEFELIIQYIEVGETEITVAIEQCVLVGNSTDESESPDPLMDEVEIDCMRIRRNGLVLWDSSEG